MTVRRTLIVAALLAWGCGGAADSGSKPAAGKARPQSKAVEREETDAAPAQGEPGDEANASSDAPVIPGTEDFTIDGFEFRDEAGNALGVGIPQAVGKTLYALRVRGLASKAGQHHLEMTVQISNAGGKVMYRMPQPLKIDLPVAEDLDGGVTEFVDSAGIPMAGAFVIRWELADALTGQTAVHEADILVE